MAKIVKQYRVYGAEGHRQRESFRESYHFDVRGMTIAVWNSDVTGTNDYSVVTVAGDSLEDVVEAFEAQLSDGIFENSRVGKIIELL